jgi:hypothetical protein
VKKAFINKSRSGHYTATIREVGTWQKDGSTFPYSEIVFRAEKLGSVEAARAAIAKATGSAS